MKSKPFLNTLGAAAAFLIPGVAFADGAAIEGLFNWALNIINGIIVPVIFALAFLVFIFKIYEYFIAGGANEEKVKEGQKFLVWSLIGFFVMFSIWGLVNLLVGTLGFNASGRPDLPTFGGSPAATTPAGGAGAGGDTTKIACKAGDPYGCPFSDTCQNGTCVPIK